MPAIDKFSMTDVQQKVADRIRASFVDLIPEDRWKALVEAEIARFTDRNVYADGGHITPLQSLIRSEIKARLIRQIGELLDSPEIRAKYSPQGNYEASDLVKQVLGELTPELVKELFASQARDLIQLLKNQLQNRSY